MINMRKLDNYMTARQFAHFSEIASSGSLNKAAENLGQTQSSLTRSLKQLEESVGAKLMERGPKGAVVTPEGTIMLECFRRVSLETRLALQAIENTTEAQKLMIRVGAAPSFGLTILPKVMEEFRTNFQETRFQIHHATPSAMLGSVESGEIDIYLGPVLETNIAVGITTELLAAIPSEIYARKDHPLAKKASVSSADLLEHRWVSLLSSLDISLPGNWRDKLSNFAYQNGLPPPSVDFETTSVIGALNIVSSGGYLVCLSQLLSDEAERRDLVALSVQEPITKHMSGIVYRSPIIRDKRLKQFLEILSRVSLAAGS